MHTIVGSYHMSGTVFIESVFKAYKLLDNSFKYVSYTHFNQVKSDDIKNHKCIVMIRHPFEIIAHGTEYHKTSNEQWLYEPLKKLNNKSYNEHILSIPNIDDQIIFEMNNCAKNTLMDMYNDIKNRNHKNILYIKFEDLHNLKNIDNICNEIANHVGNINVKTLKKVFEYCCKLMYIDPDYYKEFKYETLFKSHHYAEFFKIFPSDMLSIMNYNVINKC